MIARTPSFLKALVDTARQSLVPVFFRTALFLIFIVDTMRWLDRSATGTFWHYPLVHGIAVGVLTLYCFLATRSVARGVGYLFGDNDTHKYAS